MNIKSTLTKSMNKAKEVITDEAEKLYDLSKKHYHVTVVVDKKGVSHTINVNRPTKHTIKWRSKGY